ncbi:MAG: hypothetical protein IT450_01380 [Phycisphaerales bacterium]|nr:hypothetical protein [Phycisphaerales bacterium]
MTIKKLCADYLLGDAISPWLSRRLRLQLVLLGVAAGVALTMLAENVSRFGP